MIAREGHFEEMRQRVKSVLLDIIQIRKCLIRAIVSFVIEVKFPHRIEPIVKDVLQAHMNRDIQNVKNVPLEFKRRNR